MEDHTSKNIWVAPIGLKRLYKEWGGAQNGVDRELRVNLGRAGEVTVVKTHCTKLEPLEELTMKTKTKAL